MTRHAVDVRRIYEHPGATTGRRVLVDRLWPRGIARATAPIDEWAPDVAPSRELRRWYGHQPELFAEFAERYRAELASGPQRAALDALCAAARSGDLVLVTATRDVEHSAAAVLAALVRDRD